MTFHHVLLTLGAVALGVAVVVVAGSRTIRARVDELLQGCFYPPTRQPPKARRDDEETQR